MLARMRTSAAEWAERVRAWRESGSTAEEFAQAGGYRAKLLVWWGSELDRRSRRKTPAKRKIVMARVRVSPAPQDALAVVVGDARVVVSRGFDAGLLRDVVAALGPSR
jgi:hypothetical protein